MSKQARAIKANGRTTNGGLGGSVRTLQLLDRKGPLAKSHVAKRLGVTKPAALDHFKTLSREGLVMPVERKSVPGPGRPLELWDINREDNYTIGIIVEPPTLVGGVANFSDELVLRCEHDISGLSATEQLLPLIDDFVAQAIAHVDSCQGALRGGWVCSAGPAHMPSPKRIDFGAYLRDRHPLEFNVSSLAIGAAFGEAARFGRDTIVGVLEWSLGVSIIPCHDNQVLFFWDLVDAHKRLGLHDNGHVVIDRQGPKCACGQNGCLEAYTGGHALIEQLGRTDVRSLADLIHSAQNGDEEVLAVLHKSARTLGEFMASLVQIMGMEKLVCTGPLSQIFPAVRDSFCEGLARCLSDEKIESLAVVASDDPLDGTLIGACRAAQHHFVNG